MKFLAAVILIIVLGVGAFAVVEKVSPVAWGWFGTTNTEAGVALKGYDPMAYFIDDGPLKGSADYAYDYGDATWHFASARNRDLFAGDPAHYAPQFGGFCAYAVSKGFTADADPEAWHIEGGRLYVFADGDVRDKWVGALGEGSLQRANENWARRH